MKITVVGGGYVGLVSGACFAHLGHEVLIVEKLKEKLELLKGGKSPIYEPGLDELLEEGIKGKRLHFTDSLKEAADFSEVLFICVGTPSLADGSPDLSQVDQVVRDVARRMNSYKVFVEKSTVPVNTHKRIEGVVRRYLKDKSLEFDVVSNPEFLKEGAAVDDFLNPDRIVVGVSSQRAKEIMEEIYRPLVEKGAPLFITDPASAEIIKHAANAFLATKISFINMVSDLCEATGANVDAVADGLGFDKRIGRAFLNAGIGWGGSCFPKDLKAFVKIAEEFAVDFSLLKEVERINERRIELLMKKLKDALWTLRSKRIALWGLSFKPNTDDIREAPSIKVVQRLLKEGATVSAYDPKATDNFRRLFVEGEDLRYAKDKYEALKDAGALLILTEWQEFKEADLTKVKELMEVPIIVDGRNIYDPDEVKAMGFEYYSIGR